MPQSCPRCNRPNGDAATRCLYCGAGLAPVQAPQAGEPEPEASWPESYTVVVTQDAAAIDTETFCSATARPAAWLSLGTPVAIGTFRDLEEAMALHRAVTEAGIQATVVADSRLGDAGATLLARRGSFTASGMEFASAEGFRSGLNDRDLLLLVRARVADPESSDDGGKLRARSLSGRVVTPLAGGASRMTVLDLYAAEGRPVRIVAERFDYSMLGDDRGALATDNFDRLVERIAERAPHAHCDVSYGKVGDVDAGASVPEHRKLDIYGRRLLLSMLQTA